jgi:hypothetical protein
MPKSGYQLAVLSARDQFARTPKLLLAMITQLYFKGRTPFDPCPANPAFDGLAIRWTSNTYVNPPFKHISVWARKAIDERVHTVLLMPTRTSTLYMAKLIVPHATSIILWHNRICFPPHTAPIPVPIMTVEFSGGAAPKISACPGVKLQRVAFDLFDLSLAGGLGMQPGELYSRALVPLVRSKYGTRGVLKVEAHCDSLARDAVAIPRFAASGTSFVCVMFSPKLALLAAAAHCAAHPAAVIVAMIIPAFNAKYFAEVAPLIREIVFISPNLAFGHGTVMGPPATKSFLGSVIAVLSAKPVKFKPVAQRRPHMFLANYQNRTTI